MENHCTEIGKIPSLRRSVRNKYKKKFKREFGGG